MNAHETGILRGLIQAFLAITKGSVTAPKTTAPSANESVLSLVVQVASEILTKIESLEASSVAAASAAPAEPAAPASH